MAKTLLEMRDAANAWIDVNHPKIIDQQVAEIANWGKPFQGLPTHSDVPGEDPVPPDYPGDPPSHQTRTWEDFLADAGVAVPTGGSITISIHDFGTATCTGRWGQTTQYCLKYDPSGVVYFRDLADGGEPGWRDDHTTESPQWAPVPEES